MTTKIALALKQKPLIIDLEGRTNSARAQLSIAKNARTILESYNAIDRADAELEEITEIIANMRKAGGEIWGPLVEMNGNARKRSS